MRIEVIIHCFAYPVPVLRKVEYAKLRDGLSTFIYEIYLDTTQKSTSHTFDDWCC